MSNFKVKPYVREEYKVRVIDGIAQGQGGKVGRMLGFVSQFNTADLPDASKLPDGVLAYDLTDSKLKIVIAGAWVDAA